MSQDVQAVHTAANIQSVRAAASDLAKLTDPYKAKPDDPAWWEQYATACHAVFASIQQCVPEPNTEHRAALDRASIKTANPEYPKG